MSAKKDRVQITFFVSPSERDLLKRLAGKGRSQYLRDLILADAQRQGVPVPADTLTDTRGKYPRDSIYADRHQLTARITPDGVVVRAFADDVPEDVHATLRNDGPHKIELYLAGDGWTKDHIHDAKMEALVYISESQLD